jgi:hypothetical protein
MMKNTNPVKNNSSTVGRGTSSQSTRDQPKQSVGSATSTTEKTKNPDSKSIILYKIIIKILFRDWWRKDRCESKFH